MRAVNAFHSLGSQNYEDRRMDALLDEMLSCMNTETGINFGCFKAWLNPEHSLLEAIAKIMIHYYYWVTLFRESTHSICTVFNKDNRNLYKAVGRRFPELQAKGDPKVGLQELRDHSATYEDSRSKLSKILVSKSADTQRATAVYSPDVRLLIMACAPTPSGVRNALFILFLHRTGVRCCGLCRLPPGSLKLSAQEDKVTLSSQPQKRRGGASTTWSNTYRDKAILWLSKKFLSVQDLGSTGNGLLFGFTDSRAANKMLGSLCVRAGFPKNFFTTHGFKSGKITSDIFDAVVNGEDLCVAEQNARIACRMAENTNADKIYQRPIIGIAQSLVGKIKSISDLPMNQLHPELDEVFDKGLFFSLHISMWGLKSLLIFVLTLDFFS